MTRLPLVSVLVTAREEADGLAASLESALAQHYPPELLELVVVHDGGERAVAALAGGAAMAPERVRAIAQPGAGRLAATARALSEARGELLALLEPGDRWPVARIAGQVAALAERPEAGLVCSELLGEDESDGRPVGRLLREAPCVASSSTMLRAELLPALGPLPPELPAAAWWLVVRAACVAEIAWAPAGVTQRASEDGRDDDREEVLREALAVQRWFLRTATPESLYADALGEIWSAFAANARRLLALAGGDPFTGLVTVTDAERSEARRVLADARAALARGDTWPATALAVRAAALDPWWGPARELVAETVAARPRRASGDPLAGARRFVTLAFAEELLERPQLLAAYGARFDGGEDATLAIDASTLLPATAGHRLGELVAELGLDADGTAHLVAVLGPIDASVRAQLPARADALLTCGAPADSAAGVPAFDAASVDALHALARRASAA